MIIHRQINSCSTNMNVVNNELPAFKEKNKQRTPEGSKNPQRTCILLFLIKSGEVSLAAGLFLKGWADEKKPPSFSKTKAGRISFPSVDFWFVQSCFATIIFLVEFLSRCMWILNPLPGELWTWTLSWSLLSDTLLCTSRFVQFGVI